VAIEYRFADEHYDRLPVLAADLVRRRVAVIYATAGVPAVMDWFDRTVGTDFRNFAVRDWGA
jgi:hypothetical protein